MSGEFEQIDICRKDPRYFVNEDGKLVPNPEYNDEGEELEFARPSPSHAER